MQSALWYLAIPGTTVTSGPGFPASGADVPAGGAADGDDAGELLAVRAVAVAGAGLDGAAGAGAAAADAAGATAGVAGLALAAPAGAGPGPEPEVAGGAGAGPGPEPEVAGAAGAGAGPEPEVAGAAGAGAWPEPAVTPDVDGAVGARGGAAAADSPACRPAGAGLDCTLLSGAGRLAGSSSSSARPLIVLPGWTTGVSCVD